MHTIASALAALTLLAASRLTASAELPAAAFPGLLALSPPGISSPAPACALEVSSHACAPLDDTGVGHPGAATRIFHVSAVGEPEDRRASPPLALHFTPQDPTVGVLEALKVGDALARVGRGHWQTMALSGVALSATAGYWLRERANPLVLHLVHRGIYLGFERRF